MPAIDIQGNSLIELNPGKPPKQLPGSYVLEPIRGYWTGKADWGQARKVPFPTTAGFIIPMGRVTDLPGPPRARAITLGRRDKKGPQTTDNFGIRARITYGCGGATNTLYCDWVNGTQLSVVASSIQIDCETYAPVIGGAAYGVPAAQPDLDITSAIGCEAAEAGNATYTVLADTESGNAAITVPIPQMARELSVLQVLVAGTPGLDIGLPWPAPGGIYTFTSAQLTTLLGRYIPIPGHALYIGLAARAYWSLTFKLQT